MLAIYRVLQREVLLTVLYSFISTIAIEFPKLLLKIY